jgi:subtilisin family serine protease
VFGPDGFVNDLQLAAALLDLPDVELINLSLGGPTHDDIGLPATEAALQVLFQRKPVPVVVAAAGNGYGDRPYYPAGYKRVIAVGALDPPQPNIARRRACFSNYGSWVDAWALGVNLRSTFLSVDARTPPPTPPNCLGFVHDPGTVFQFRGWAKWSGTSFSTAVVTGSIAATIRPGIDPTEAAFRLVGAAALPRLPGEGLGTIVDGVRYG